MGLGVRTLGHSGLPVSELALGTMMFGRWGNTDVDECHRMVHRAIDAGITLIDTADMHDDGVSEEILGAALVGRRDQVVLATKVGPLVLPAGVRDRIGAVVAPGNNVNPADAG